MRTALWACHQGKCELAVTLCNRVDALRTLSPEIDVDFVVEVFLQNTSVDYRDALAVAEATRDE